MLGTEETGENHFWRARRLLSGLAALATVGAGFGLAFSARTRVWDSDPSLFWAFAAAAPVLVGVGAAWFLFRRDQLRRESAWDIFVERELERETHKPAAPEREEYVQVGKLVKGRRRSGRRRRKHARRDAAARIEA